MESAQACHVFSVDDIHLIDYAYILLQLFRDASSESQALLCCVVVKHTFLLQNCTIDVIVCLEDHIVA